MARISIQRPDALGSVVARGAAEMNSGEDDEVIAWRIGDVVVDLARPEPADVGAAVDLAQPDSISCDAARSGVAGHKSPTRIGRARQPLSSSWPSGSGASDPGSARARQLRHQERSPKHGGQFLQSARPQQP